MYTTAALPLSQPAPQPTPTLSGSSPTPTVAISDNVSLDQLLRDIYAPNTGTDTSAFSAGVLPPFQPQAASTQQHSLVSPDVSRTVGARPRSSVSYPQGNTGNCAIRTLNINFCYGGVYITLNHYMHRRRRRAVSSFISLCGCFQSASC